MDVGRSGCVFDHRSRSVGHHWGRGGVLNYGSRGCVRYHRCWSGVFHDRGGVNNRGVHLMDGGVASCGWDGGLHDRRSGSHGVDSRGGVDYGHYWGWGSVFDHWRGGCNGVRGKAMTGVESMASESVIEAGSCTGCRDAGEDDLRAKGKRNILQNLKKGTISLTKGECTKTYYNTYFQIDKRILVTRNNVEQYKQKRKQQIRLFREKRRHVLKKHGFSTHPATASC